MSHDAETLMRSIIERIATGPELSKDIPETQAYEGMRAILDQRIGDVQAAVFLIALRMKRESREESRGVFRALVDGSLNEPVAVDELLTVADPFNGFDRCLPMSPFVPAVLAACGQPTLSTGVEAVGPKFGLTHHQLLAAAGKSVSLTIRQAASQLADPAVGWAYLDQSVTSPKLFRLGELRRLIVKRTLLSTCEVMLKPLTARRRNSVCIGYVHTGYPPIYAMLAELAGYDSAIIVKGVEGGITPSLNTRAKVYHARTGMPGEPLSLRPGSIGIDAGGARAVPAPFEDLEANAARAVELGLAALAGEPGIAREGLVYAAAVALAGAGRVESIESGARTARRALDSGEAKSRFAGAR
ncbi:MAG: hypothetical protein WB783_17380 [Arenicellales bacterium]